MNRCSISKDEELGVGLTMNILLENIKIYNPKISHEGD